MMELLHFVISMLMMIMVKSVESQGSTVVAGSKYLFFHLPKDNKLVEVGLAEAMETF